MTNLRGLYSLHCVAAGYQTRPSAILGVEDGWAAYQLDAAALTLAGMVEEARAEGMDAETVLRAIDDGGRRTKDGVDVRRFREPTGQPVKKMRIPESGVW